MLLEFQVNRQLHDYCELQLAEKLIHYLANDLSKLFVAACFDYVIDFAFIVSHATENLGFCLFMANSSQKIRQRRSFKKGKIFSSNFRLLVYNLTLNF